MELRQKDRGIYLLSLHIHLVQLKNVTEYIDSTTYFRYTSSPSQLEKKEC